MQSWLILLIALGCAAKQFDGTLVFAALGVRDCNFIGKYGSENARYAVEVKYYSIGAFKQAQEDLIKDNEMVSLKLVAFDREQHEWIQKAFSESKEDIFKGAIKAETPTITLDLRTDMDYFGRFVHPKRGIHYFYFCDDQHEIKSYMGHQVGEEAQNESVNEGIFSAIKSLIFKANHSAVVYKLRLMSEAESSHHYHHSIEQSQTDTICLLLFFFNACIFVYLVLKIRNYYSNNEKVDYPLLVIAMSVMFQNVGLIFKFIHFWILSASGDDVRGLEIGSRMWSLFADVSLCLLLIFMSKGFGVIDVDFARDYVAEFAGILLLCAARYVWILIGYINHTENEDVYHIYDGTTGKLELLNTIALYFWFMSSINLVAVFKQSKFLNLKLQLIVYATIYLCCTPVAILLVYWLDPMHQHQLSTALSLGSHMLVCAIAGLSFTNKRGVYMKISTSNSIELDGSTKIT